MTWPSRACPCASPSIARGLSGADGATHAGSFDIGYLSNLPGFTVMAASDEAELVHMVATAAAHEAGPIAFRYPRGAGAPVWRCRSGARCWRSARAGSVQEGEDVAFLSFGAYLGGVLGRRQRCWRQEGVSPSRLADARFAKPLDTDLLLRTGAAASGADNGGAGGRGWLRVSVVMHALARERGVRPGVGRSAMSACRTASSSKRQPGRDVCRCGHDGDGYRRDGPAGAWPIGRCRALVTRPVISRRRHEKAALV